jgi:hypothetical protein
MTAERSEPFPFLAVMEERRERLYEVMTTLKELI